MAMIFHCSHEILQNIVNAAQQEVNILEGHASNHGQDDGAIASMKSCTVPECQLGQVTAALLKP